MLPAQNNSAEFVIFLYLYFDQIWPQIQIQLLANKQHSGGRPGQLSVPEVLTLGCLFTLSGIPTLKRFYAYAQAVWHGWFKFPNYQNFVAAINRTFGLASMCLQHLLKFFRSKLKPHALDATALPVCRVRREYSHKVCRGLAKKGYSTMGWFFGFKLHAIVSREGYLLSVALTKGNVDDRTPVEKLVTDLTDCLIVVDAGYISAALRNKLLQKGVHLFYATKRTMKKLMTNLQHCLLKSRQIIETIFSVLKERMFMASNLPRSIAGHFARYIFTLLGYQLSCLARLV